MLTLEERNELVVNYMPFANSLAAKYFRKASKRISFDELKSAAYMGLVKASIRYKIDKNILFSTFARSRVEGEMKDYLRIIYKYKYETLS